MTPLFNYIPTVLCLMALLWACLMWLKLQKNYLGGLAALLLVIAIAQLMVAMQVQEQETWSQLTLLATGLLCLLVVYLVERLTYAILSEENWNQETKADWLSLVDRAPFGYYHKDYSGQKHHNGGYSFVNKQFANWLEQTESSLIGKSDMDIFPEEIANAHFASDQQLLETGEMQESLEEIVQSNGEVLLLHLMKYPRFNASKETIGLQGVLWDVTSSDTTEQEQDLRLSQLRNLQSALRQLAEEGESILSADDPFALIVPQITIIAAETLDVERVGIWLFDKKQKELQCVDQYDRSTDSRINDLKFSISGCPAYFSAIENEEVIDAIDARHDSRTHELASRYLRPMGIHSTLIATIRAAGKVRGVLSFEQTTGQRVWTDDEAVFAETLTCYIAQTLDTKPTESRSVQS